jgi:hypothetical protein
MFRRPLRSMFSWSAFFIRSTGLTVPGLSWFESTDEGAETQRRALFRAEYRAVESGVDGLLVRSRRRQQVLDECSIRYRM